MTRAGLTDEERFYMKVVGDEYDECWLWQAAVGHWGYGNFRLGKKFVRAHRWAWQHMVGEIPPDLVLDHLCRNPACVNTWHLELVSIRENTQRGLRGDLHESRTVCVHGHQMTADNVRISTKPDGGVQRTCRACENNRSKVRRRLRKVQS